MTAGGRRVAAFFRKVRFLYPLTETGSVLFLIAFFLLGSSIAEENAYGILLSILAYTGLFLGAAGCRIQALRIRDLGAELETGRPPAARTETGLPLQVEPFRSPAFFRIHFRMRGRERVGRGAFLRMTGELATSSGGRLFLPLQFPLAGSFDGSLRISVRDMFGLTRAQVREDEPIRFPAVPGPFPGNRLFRLEAAGGMEEKNRQKQADVERYYMREYMPGDRSRDINWKSASRFSQLYTRVSPFTQEKTKVITVHFRHFRRRGPESLDALLHLDYLKSWLLFFLRKVKSDNPGYQFRIETGFAPFTLEEETDIESFSHTLSTITFQEDPMVRSAPDAGGEAYVFTTPFDRTLGAFLAASGSTKTAIYRTAFPGPGETPADAVPMALIGSFRDFPVPGLWALRRERAETGRGTARSGTGETAVLDIRLFQSRSSNDET